MLPYQQRAGFLAESSTPAAAFPSNAQWPVQMHPGGRASLQPPVQNLTQAFPIQRPGGMLVHTGGFGRLHILGKGVGRHGNNGHLRGTGFGQRTDGRGARFCILSVYNFKSLAVGMAVW